MMRTAWSVLLVGINDLCHDKTWHSNRIVLSDNDSHHCDFVIVALVFAFEFVVTVLLAFGLKGCPREQVVGAVFFEATA